MCGARLQGILFCAFLTGFLALHLALPDREESALENRRLQQRPALSATALADGSFMERAEAYISDQFPFRDGWTALKARTEWAAGKREFHGVYLTGDMLFQKGAAPMAQAEKNLAACEKFADAAGIPAYLGLIPAAWEVQGEKLTAGAPQPDRSGLFRRASETGLLQVDYLSALKAHESEPIYYRTDPHWTSLGAYYGYAALCKALGASPTPPDAFSPETASEQFLGTLASISGVRWLRPDQIEFFVPEGKIRVTSYRSGKPEESALYDRSHLGGPNAYSAFLGGNQPLCVLENPDAAEDKKLLLLRDSYADALAPFLACTFREVHLMDLRNYRLAPLDYIRERGIETVMLSYSAQNFVTDASIPLLCAGI